MSALGVIGDLLDIFKKSLKNLFDPSMRIEKDLEKLEEERRAIIAKPQTDSSTRRLNDLDGRRKQLLKAQARLAARV